MMTRTNALLALVSTAFLSATIANAVEARYFLSLQGLSDPNDTESDPIVPSNIGVDPVEWVDGSTTVRFYIWAQLLTPQTDLIGFNLAFRATGDVQIVATNIWSNALNNASPFFRRWRAFPGTANDGAPGQIVDVGFTLRDFASMGVSNGSQAANDDQWIDAIGAALVGYIDVNGTEGEIHFVNDGSGFLQISSSNRIYLGFDDATGAPPEVPDTPYDSTSPEAELRAILAGDMNCDGVISVGDIGGFVSALTDPDGYATAYPDCNLLNADINADNTVTVGDIGGFVSLLIGG